MGDLVGEILKLKKARGAIILVHNYQLGEVQDIADFKGDSLELSIIAGKIDCKVIVFCGVYFMAETASILSPDKKVIMPDINAGCPMADMITAEKLRALKNNHPKAAVVGYVNTPAEVKAELDICCTSTNAVKVVESLKEAAEIIFVPDKYLTYYVATQTKRKLIPWNGYCPTHVKILPEDILKQKELHPKAEVVVHPECTPHVIELADRVLSTSGMCKYAKESKAKEIIVGTEVGLLYRLKKENPDKTFYAATEKAVCPNMKLTTLEKILWSLQDLKYEVKVPSGIRLRAVKAVRKMLEIV